MVELLCRLPATADHGRTADERADRIGCATSGTGPCLDPDSGRLGESDCCRHSSGRRARGASRSGRTGRTGVSGVSSSGRPGCAERRNHTAER